MTPERWLEVEALFHDLASAPECDRPRLIAAISNPETRAEVESLLTAQQATIGWVNGAISEAASAVSAAPQQLGAWRVTGLIGHGGMGAVYRGVRADHAFEKQVAIKLLPLGLNTPAARERFREERRILAGLDHPNIARLLDGGESEGGASYIVLELVEGVNILEYAATHRLSREMRLRLFLQVCAAVQYAHQNLVVHRDLKPGNILVARDGTPKLLDFGIAKLLGPDATHTVTGLHAMTPRYASPEQIRGNAITTATDIYSLGMLLQELLTGKLPYSTDGLTPAQIERTICESVPASPGVSRDLDNIILMALRKEPARRYASVQQLADDIERSLDHRRVLACPDTRRYRIGKFIRRNRLSLAAAAAVTIALCAGLFASMYQARLAQRRFDQVRQLANSFLFDFDESIREVPGTTRSRELIVSTALRYLNSLAQDAAGDPGLQAELAGAYEKVADVQGSPSIPNLGRQSAALDSYRTARKLLEGVVAKRPSQAAAAKGLAQVCLKMADLQLVSGDHTAARESIQTARSAADKARLAGARDADFEFIFAGTWFRTGDEFFKKSEYQEARQAFEHAAAAYRRAYELRPSDRYRQAAAIVASRLGRISLNTGDPATAVARQTEALQIREELSRLHPETQAYRRGVAASLAELGDALGQPAYFSLGDMAKSEDCYRRAAALQEKAVQADAGNVLARTDLLFALYRLATVQALRQPEDAIATLHRVLALPASLAETAVRSDIRQIVALSHCRLGEAYLHKRDYRAGIEESRTGIRMLQALVTSPETAAELGLVRERALLGDLLSASGDTLGARTLWREAVANLSAGSKRNLEDFRDEADVYLRLASCGGAEACEWKRRAVAVWQECRRRMTVTAIADARLKELEPQAAACR